MAPTCTYGSHENHESTVVAVIYIYMSDNIQKLKSVIRNQQLQRRSEITASAKKSAEREIARNFIANIPLNKKERIAGYHALGTEIDINLLLETLMEMGHDCALPVVVDKEKPLIFRKFVRGLALTKSRFFGIMEPPEKAPVINPSLIIVPLLAFDRKGFRLGYGGGFYDRTLALLSTNSDNLVVGIGYSFQEIKQVPHDLNDAKLDAIVTEKEVIVVE